MTPDLIAHPPAIPIQLGYTSGPQKKGRLQHNKTLHRSYPSKDLELARMLHCTTSFAKTVDSIVARVEVTANVDIVTELLRLNIAPSKLCRRCFNAPPWSIAQAYRTALAVSNRSSQPLDLTLTRDQAAVIAYLVASTKQRQAVIPENAGPAGDPVTTVTLSAAAHAVVSGFLAPDDAEDPENGINQDGILASDHTWDELRRRFPLSAYHAWATAYPGANPTEQALVAPLRTAFPISAFWGYVAAGSTDDPNYEPGAGY
ncbi:hypothetical protein CFP71_13505 [Amycolatopsis thailandensis]|uniref:Uncharacterized protein n=1 Tax=Amycolatopsis thailandensis TaxID=589330 RepID=A0A229SBX5_9PSEU|nr:hypothetical protein [Amycolatopsis thailandensis]OXM56437.1 hypothetical protein CFP71_13505 [Amycolatopsis thailandensis]